MAEEIFNNQMNDQFEDRILTSVEESTSSLQIEGLESSSINPEVRPVITVSVQTLDEAIEMSGNNEVVPQFMASTIKFPFVMACLDVFGEDTDYGQTIVNLDEETQEAYIQKIKEVREGDYSSDGLMLWLALDKFKDKDEVSSHDLQGLTLEDLVGSILKYSSNTSLVHIRDRAGLEILTNPSKSNFVNTEDYNAEEIDNLPQVVGADHIERWLNDQVGEGDFRITRSTMATQEDTYQEGDPRLDEVFPNYNTGDFAQLSKVFGLSLRKVQEESHENPAYKLISECLSDIPEKAILNGQGRNHEIGAVIADKLGLEFLGNKSGNMIVEQFRSRIFPEHPDESWNYNPREYDVHQVNLPMSEISFLKSNDDGKIYVLTYAVDLPIQFKVDNESRNWGGLERIESEINRVLLGTISGIFGDELATRLALKMNN